MTFYWIAVAAVAITSSARLTRLATYDHLPPVKWLRNKYADLTDGSDWQLLAFCGYCASFWITAAVALWGYFTDFHEPWWVINGIFGASYLAAILMAHDGDDGDDGDEGVQTNVVLGQVSDFPVIDALDTGDGDD